MVRWRRFLLISGLGIGLLVGLVACGPEASRARGRHDRADPGNRTGTALELHGDEPLQDRIYYQTPKKVAGE